MFTEDTSNEVVVVGEVETLLRFVLADDVAVVVVVFLDLDTISTTGEEKK